MSGASRSRYAGCHVLDSQLSRKKTMKRRFEFVGGSSAKFWEVTVEGNAATVCYGRLGTDGQTQTKTFADGAVAQKHADGLVRQKLAKGYVECQLCVGMHFLPIGASIMSEYLAAHITIGGPVPRRVGAQALRGSPARGVNARLGRGPLCGGHSRRSAPGGRRNRRRAGAAALRRTGPLGPVRGAGTVARSTPDRLRPA